MKNDQMPLIYLVDDKVEIAKVVSLYLQQTIRSEYFSGGRQLLEVLQNEQNQLPEVIVTDINMPEMDGYELLTQIRADKRLKDIPVLILSSIDDSQQRVTLLEMGANDFLTKPFNPEELKLRLEKLLQ